MGREQWFLTPKDGISLLGIRSKIERQGVLKTLVERLLRGFLLFKTSKMVTFGDQSGIPVGQKKRDQSGIPVGQKKSYAKIVANLKIKNGISLTPRN